MYEIGLFDISKLPPETLLYVNNGGWYRYVGLADGMKVLYVGVSKDHPLDSIKHGWYSSRCSLCDEYPADITIINAQPSFCRDLMAVKAPGKISSRNKVNFLLGMISENSYVRDSDAREAVETWKRQILKIVADLEDEIKHCC